MRYVVPAAVFAVLVVFFWIGLSKDPSEVPSPFIGKPAPTFRLPELRNPEATVSNANLQGQPTVLNVWATWCVGCRQEGRDYCARVCCSQAVKNALTLKKQSPERDVYVLYRDMRTYGFKEDYYLEAAEKGVRFVRWVPTAKPEVEAARDEDGHPVLRVTVPDPILGQRLAIDANFVALSAAGPASAQFRESELSGPGAAVDGCRIFLRESTQPIKRRGGRS